MTPDPRKPPLTEFQSNCVGAIRDTQPIGASAPIGAQLPSPFQQPRKARKKPVVIEYMRWDGNNEHDLDRFMPGKFTMSDSGAKLHIDTLEGTITADIFDYIVKGVKGEFYPVKPEIFEATYETAE